MLLGGIRVFALGLRFGSTWSCLGLTREKLLSSRTLINDCLLSALQPQLARTQHIEGRPEKSLVFLSKMKLQRAVRDSHSSKNALVKFLLICLTPPTLMLSQENCQESAACKLTQ